MSISKCRRRYILTNTGWKIKILSSGGQIFFSSIHVFEILIFGKLMQRRFLWYIGLPTFLLLFLLCVQSSKSYPKGSILMEPTPMVSNGKISQTGSLESATDLRFLWIILCISLITGWYVGVKEVIHFCSDEALAILTWFSLVVH